VGNGLHHRKWAKGVRTALLVLAAILLVFCAFCGCVYLAQDRMIFYRVKDPGSRAFLRGMPGYSEVGFTAANGKTYHGMLRRSQNEDAPLIIYFGGNGECSYKSMRQREEGDGWRYFQGYHFLQVDYEGYGLNEGQADYLNMYEESLAVYDYARTLPGMGNSRIVSVGFSIGTGPATYLAAHRPVAGLVAIAPYANGTDLYNNALPVFRGLMELLVRQKLPSEEYAPKVTCPVQIVASKGDKVVPYASSERLAGCFPGEVGFFTLNHATHNEVLVDPEALDEVQLFLERVTRN